MNCEQAYAKKANKIEGTKFFLEASDIKEPRIISKDLANILYDVDLHKINLWHSEHSIIVAVNENGENASWHGHCQARDQDGQEPVVVFHNFENG